MKFIRGIAAAVAMFGALSGAGIPAVSQANIEWVKQLAPVEQSVVLSNVRTVRANDGSLFVSGVTPQSSGAQRLFVSKFSPSGELQWRARVPGEPLSQSQQPITLFEANDVVAITRVANGGNAILTRLGAQGQILWSRSQSFSIGTKAFVASNNSQLYAVAEYQLARILPSGAESWSRSISSSNGSTERRTALVLSSGDVVYQSEYGVRRFAATNGDELPFSSVFGALDVVQTVDGNLVFVQSSQYIASSATIVYSLRSVSPAGVTLWTQQYAVPTSSVTNVRLFANPVGGVYVTHARNLQEYGDVALINGTGAIQWNRNYFRVYGFAQRNGVLHGLRYDADASGGVNGFFPIQAANGDLGTPGFSTTSSPAHRLEEWTGTANGFLAISSTGVAQRILEVAPTGAVLWSQESARLAEETMVDRTSCLMPRLVLSAPTRVSTFTQTRGTPNLQNRLGSTTGDGTSHQLSAIDTGHCATSFDSAGGSFRATQTGVRKADPTGATVWSASTSSSNASGINRLVFGAANGDVLVAGHDKLSRLDGAGAVLWETAYNPVNANTFFSTPKYVSEDATGNTIVAGGENGDPWAVRVSPSGSLLYRQALGTPACTDFSPRFEAVSTGDLYVVSSACSEGRVYKYGVSGSLLWQRTISAMSPDVVVNISSLAISSGGDIFVGGCSSPSYGNEAFGARTMLQSYTGAGNERWNRTADFFLNSKECVATMAVEGSKLVVAIASHRSIRSSYLATFDVANGSELWRSADVLSNPVVVPSDMRAAESGRLFVLGDNDPAGRLAQIASLRKIDVTTTPTLRSTFLSLPLPSPVFRTPFSVTLGLQTIAGASYVATQPTTIWLTRGSGTGTLIGDSSCTVAVGQSSCTVSSLTYDRAETGVSLVAEVDGSPPTSSATFEVLPAPTQTTMEVLSLPPYYSFDRIRVRYTVTGVAPMQGNEGYISRSPYSESCTSLPQLAGDVLREECTVRIRVGEQLQANFYSYSGYENSSATPVALSVSPLPLTLQATLTPSPRVVVGTQFLLTAKLFGARGENVSNENEIYVEVRNSSGITVCSLYAGGSSGARSCYLSASVTGVQNYTVTVQPSSSIVTPNPVNLSVEVIAGLSLSGNLTTNGNVNPTFCATSVNADCDVSAELNRYFCTLPIGWTGTIYPQVDDLTARATPNAITISGEAGSIVRDVFFNVGPSCSFDTDANGAIENFSDGLFVLRAMLGMPAAVNETSPVSACARRAAPDRTSFVSGQIASLKYDVDGNGSVSAATDGVLLMRALLGFRGDSVTVGALGDGATRQSWESIRSYLAGTCGVSTLN
jgi:PQQ-like domain